MLDLSHLPVSTGAAEVQVLYGSSTAAGNDWQTWQKPRGKTMVNIFLIGKGGNGGLGAIGANSTAAGGGGGGSGGQTVLTMPLALLPDVLFFSLAGVTATSTVASYVAIGPKLTAGAGAPTANDTLMIANGGGNGGNASAGSPGTAGTAGSAATAATMPLGFAFASVLAGQAGIAGGVSATAGGLTLPLTGLRVTGGTGGGGLPAAATGGTNGGDITGAGRFPTVFGGTGLSSATFPPNPGNPGFMPIAKLLYFVGGTGSGSTHGSATGAGLAQSKGGDGGFGCGGGGTGGALTGSTVATPGNGGVALAVITCW